MTEHQQLAFELETHLIDTDQWDRDDVPEEARELAHKELALGMPSAIGFHEDGVGWFVLVTQGQGPAIAWVANRDKLP